MIIKIARKELKSLFASPMGWIILALLQFVFGTFFLIGVDQYFQTMGEANRLLSSFLAILMIMDV